jgi:hypothetical protein
MVEIYLLPDDRYLTKKGNMAAFDLLVPTQTLFLGALSYAVLIEQNYGQFLQPVTEGIYRPGDTEPILRADRNYFTISYINGNVQYKPLSDFKTCLDAVYDEYGKLLITEFAMIHKENFLTKEPTVPVKGLAMVELLVTNYLTSISQIPGFKKNLNHKIDNLLLEGYAYLNYEGHLENICEPLLRMITTFVGNDTWYYYFIRKTMTDLIIEKTIDYRIYEYHKREEEADERARIDR